MPKCHAFILVIEYSKQVSWERGHYLSTSDSLHKLLKPNNTTPPNTTLHSRELNSYPTARWWQKLNIHPDQFKICKAVYHLKHLTLVLLENNLNFAFDATTWNQPWAVAGADDVGVCGTLKTSPSGRPAYTMPWAVWYIRGWAAAGCGVPMTWKNSINYGGLQGPCFFDLNSTSITYILGTTWIVQR